MKGLSARRGLCLGALSIASLVAPAAQAQGFLGNLLDDAKRKAEARAREELDKATRAQPTVPAAPPATPTVPAAPAPEPSRGGSLYQHLASFESHWPPPEAYVPPAERSQARTPVALGTPDSKCCGPMTSAGKPSWVWSELELKTLSWGNELPVRGSAGAPEYVKLNINNTPARQKWITTFDGWIRATYTPMGTITALFREIYPEKATHDHVPIIYGANEVLYHPVVKKGKVDRSPSPPGGWINIYANQVPGVDPAWSVNVPGQNYAFVMGYDRDLRFTAEPLETARMNAEADAVRARIGIDAPVYLTASNVVVLLTRDNRLPARQMTIGEALDVAEPGIRRQQVRDPSSPTMYARRLEMVEKLRARYAGRLDRPAFIYRSQFSTQDFYDTEGMFEPGDKGNHYPLYTFDPPAYEGAKTDTPQWLVITFPRLRKGDSWAQRMAHDTMADHFNYAYVRDAIFNPAKVAGQPYRPRP